MASHSKSKAEPLKRQKKIPSSIPNVVNFMLSGSAAVMSKTASAPIERVKLLIQSQNELIKAQRLSTPYLSASDCVQRIFSNEGVLSFWRGNLTNCIRYFNYQALNFTLKEQIKYSVFGTNLPSSDSLKLKSVLLSHIVIGGTAGLCSGTLLYSLDYTRTRLANDILLHKESQRQFTGIIDVYRQTLRSDGILGLYRGYLITCGTIVMYRGLYFGLYDSMKVMHPQIMDKSYSSKFIVGVMVSATASVVVYPMDTVRRRMMMTSIGQFKYNGNIHCIRSIVEKEGVRSFYKGCAVNIFRAFAGAGTLVGFDLFQSLYRNYTTND